MSLPRRTVEEIITYHELEDTLVDVYVEGATDEDLLRWYFRRTKQSHVQVYSIDMIDVADAGAVAGSSGNRQRLVALAMALSGRTKYGKISCVCDRDFHGWMPVFGDASDVLLLTDFASMEGYYFCAEVLEKFLTLAIGSSTVSEMQLLAVLTPLLEECFLIRLAVARLGWNLHWITPERCCSVAQGDQVAFDTVDFIKRLLSKSGNIQRTQELLTEIARLRATFSGDPRLRMHGHDFTGLLAWYLRKRGNKSVGDADQLTRMLMACVREETLRGFSLFAELDRRASMFGQSSKRDQVD